MPVVGVVPLGEVGGMEIILHVTSFAEETDADTPGAFHYLESISWLLNPDSLPEQRSGTPAATAPAASPPAGAARSGQRSATPAKSDSCT